MLNPTESLLTGIDALAENQQRYLELRNTDTISSQMNAIVSVLKSLSWPQRGQTRPVENLDALLGIMEQDYGGRKMGFNEHVMPALKEFFILALEANGRQDIVDSIDWSQDNYHLSRELYPVLKGTPLLDQPLETAADLIAKMKIAEVEAQKRKMDQKIDSFVKKHYDASEQEDIKRFLQVEWYKDPAKPSSKVTQIRKMHEHRGAKEDVEMQVSAINSDQNKRQFTTKQLNKINELYQSELSTMPKNPISDLVKATKSLLDPRIPELIGTANYSYDSNPESATAKAIVAGQAKLQEERPKIRDELKMQIKAKIDIKNQAGFWKGVKSFINKLEGPFQKWLAKKEEKAKIQSGLR